MLKKFAYAAAVAVALVAGPAFAADCPPPDHGPGCPHGDSFAKGDDHDHDGHGPNCPNGYAKADDHDHDGHGPGCPDGRA